MSKISILAQKDKAFSAKNRTRTYRMITLKALEQQCSSLSRRKSSSLRGVTEVVREMFPVFTDDECEKAQDNISEWFKNHKGDSEYDTFRNQLPFIFEGPIPVRTSVKATKFLASEETKETPQNNVVKISDNEVATVQQYAYVERVTMIETPSGYKIHL
jgi:hypothetical protein